MLGSCVSHVVINSTDFGDEQRVSYWYNVRVKLDSCASRVGFMIESCWGFPRTSATHFACYVGLMCEACWFHLRVMLGSCVRQIVNSSTDLSDERRESCWVHA